MTDPLLLESIFVLLYGTVSTLILSGYADAALAKREVAERANLINNEERTGYANL